MVKRLKKPELLSPVSDMVSLRAAIKAGCDSVYFGVKGLNMRATAKNFELEQLKKVADICHEGDVKPYLTINTLIYDDEIKMVKKTISKAKKAGIDAVIVWDVAAIEEARKAKMPFHISTQANISNNSSGIFYKKLGAERIILARELNLDQIKEIKKKAKIDVEVFIHGAMCVSVSGRCFMSQEIFGRSANRGDCLQPCRRKYLIKDVEEAHELELGKHYVMSPKDLCALPFIEKLIDSGIDCFKIEGRARSPEYVSVVTEVYREAIDSYVEGKLDKRLKNRLMDKLKTVYNRDFSSGFFLGKPLDGWSDPDSKATSRKVFIGVVKNYYPKQGVAEIMLQAKGLKKGEKIMFQGPTTGVFEQSADSLQRKEIS